MMGLYEMVQEYNGTSQQIFDITIGIVVDLIIEKLPMRRPHL